MMDEKKERIIKAAEKIFAHFGIQKPTMDEIAKKAHMGKSTLYYYFKSKEEIFAEVIRKDSAVFKQELNEAIKKAATPQEKISNYVFTRMKHLKELGNYYTILLFHWRSLAGTAHPNFELRTGNLLHPRPLYQPKRHNHLLDAILLYSSE